jgi:hypothetical protein
MAHSSSEEDGKLDLVPMIDCIMLLLMFFILTTKFSSEEKAISNLLPTDKGQSGPSTSKPKENLQVNIVVFPDPMGKGYQPSEYRDQLRQLTPPSGVIGVALLRIGNSDPIRLDRSLLSAKDGKVLETELNAVHQYIYDQLARYEVTGERKDQTPIVIHCFSGLSWRYALVAYDAVRAYEAKTSNVKYNGNPDELQNMREVSFAPPRIRNYDQNELGNELFEIIHMK